MKKRKAPGKKSPLLEYKEIGGALHVRVQCQLCKEFVWTRWNPRLFNYECDTCREPHHENTTGGGRRVIRKAEPLGG